MIEVNQNEKIKFLANFSLFKHVIAVDAALKGYTKCRLFVDQLEAPELFIIWNDYDGFYVSATPTVSAHLIKAGIQNILEICAIEDKEFVIYLDHALESSIDSILPTGQHEKLHVISYSNEFLEPLQVSSIPFDIVNTNEIELSDIYAEHDLITAIKATWETLEDFEANGLGLILYEGERIIGYCISEHVTEAAVEFTVEVSDSHHQKGLGTALGKSMINLCVEKNKTPFCYCTDDHEAAMKLTKKIGLIRQSDFNIWYFELEEGQA